LASLSAENKNEPAAPESSTSSSGAELNDGETVVPSMETEPVSTSSSTLAALGSSTGHLSDSELNERILRDEFRSNRGSWTEKVTANRNRNRRQFLSHRVSLSDNFLELPKIIDRQNQVS
jgi:hypothetical protein